MIVKYFFTSRHEVSRFSSIQRGNALGSQQPVAWHCIVSTPDIQNPLHTATIMEDHTASTAERRVLKHKGGFFSIS
jgi:hypothetical protein